MSCDILTDGRVRALARINRFAGWVARDYSVLEHSVIGALVLREFGHPVEEVKAFLLHDFEESEFGDIITPVKSKWMKLGYRWAVRRFNEKLTLETDVRLSYASTGRMDAVMTQAEMRTVWTKGTWDGELTDEHRAAIVMIETSRVFDPVSDFWEILNG